MLTDKAARTLATVMGVNVAAVPQLTHKKQTPSATKSLFHGVSYHIARQRWVVNRASVGSTFASAEEAARHVQGHGGSARAGQKKQRFSPKQMIRRIRCLRQVYYQGQHCHMPADVDAFQKHCREAAKMHKTEPATQVLAMHFKYKPWMDALHKVWQRVQRSGGRQQLWDVLVGAAKLIARDPVKKEWVDNAGRKVCRHSGGAQVLVNLGILKKGRQGPGALQLYAYGPKEFHIRAGPR